MAMSFTQLTFLAKTYVNRVDKRITRNVQNEGLVVHEVSSSTAIQSHRALSPHHKGQMVSHRENFHGNMLGKWMFLVYGYERQLAGVNGRLPAREMALGPISLNGPLQKTIDRKW